MMPLLLILSLLTGMCRAAQAPASFQKVMVVIFENTSYDEAMAQPFFAQLAAAGALLTNYHAVAHPSQPNYIALVSGSTQGVKSDKNVDLKGRSLADLLEAKGRSWKVYAEGYPGNCFLDARSGKYVRKHVPFLSFTSIQGDAARCGRVVDSSQLDADAASGALPDFSLYIPDLNDDGHDTDPAAASQWLAKAFGPRLKDPAFMKGLLLVATFDEDDAQRGGSPANANRIATILFGDAVQPGARSAASYTHYSLLRSVEDAFGLGTLGANDASAPAFSGVWK